MKTFGELVDDSLWELRQRRDGTITEQPPEIVVLCLPLDSYRELDPAARQLLDGNYEQRATDGEHIAYAVPEIIADRLLAMTGSGAGINRIGAAEFSARFARDPSEVS